MILKKPYAFFIKRFKLFHLIIFSLSAILLYRTSLIYSFMKEYVKTTPNVIGKDLTSSLFAPWLYVLIVILIVINIIIIVVMIKKDKPYMYYIMNIILYIGVLITYITSHNVIKHLETMLVATKTTLAIRDITNIARLLQSISAIFYLVRATGFDIKKFDFVRDLQGLDISEEDSEEIEVALEFEKNVFIRNIKKNLRNAKYYYKENKFILNIIILLGISLIFLLIYINLNKYNKTYSENDFFSASNFNIGIKESYILTNDYKGDKIITDDYALIALKISINSTSDQTLPNKRALLVVNGTQYYHIKDYSKRLIDLGNVYDNQKITSEFNDYVLVYQIPKEDITSDMVFRYIDNMEYKRGETITNSIDVKLKPKNLDELEQKTEQYELTNEIDTTSNLSDYKITINNYEIKEKFITTYNSCVTTTECYDFKEILMPSVTRNKEKALLKVEGNITYEETKGNIKDLYDIINYFGSIEYIYNGKKYTETNDFNEVISNKSKTNDTYYIEVNKEILEASEIKLSFNIRNMKYQYILKGDING